MALQSSNKKKIKVLGNKLQALTKTDVIYEWNVTEL